jgi:site-specific recombinase XerD
LSCSASPRKRSSDSSSKIAVRSKIPTLCQYIVRQAATRAKLSAHPHTLRHSCGYYLADRGTDFRTMQDYMGHKNPRHTAHYTRISGRKFVGLFK